MRSAQDSNSDVHAQRLKRLARHVCARMFVVSLVETLGIAIAAAFCVVAGVCIFVGTAIVSGPGFLGVLFSLAVLAAGAWAFVRRTHPLTALIEVDTQLKTSDLFSSAYAALNRDDEFSRQVVALASTQCIRIQPGDLVLHKLGIRAWSGIGLLIALGLAVVSLVGINEAPTMVDASVESMQVDGSQDRTANFATYGSPLTKAADHQNSGDLESSSERPAGEMSRTSAQAGGPDAMASAGAGEAQTRRSSQNWPIAPLGDRVNPSAEANAGARVSSGAGASDLHRTDEKSSESMTGTTSHVAPGPAAPWQSDRWPQAQQKAADAIGAGKVPPEYRDLVRDYFDRH